MHYATALRPNNQNASSYGSRPNHAKPTHRAFGAPIALRAIFPARTRRPALHKRGGSRRLFSRRISVLNALREAPPPKQSNRVALSASTKHQEAHRIARRLLIRFFPWSTFPPLPPVVNRELFPCGKKPHDSQPDEYRKRFDRQAEKNFDANAQPSFSLIDVSTVTARSLIESVSLKENRPAIPDRVKERRSEASLGIFPSGRSPRRPPTAGKPPVLTGGQTPK